jgi:VanZ family protein
MSFPRVSTGWLASAAVVSALLVLGAPFIGQVRTALRAAAGDRFAALMAAVVVVIVAAAVLTAVARIRDRWRERLTALAAALALGVGYALAARTGNPEVDAVERFHFVEYGIISALFYRAWRPAGDMTVLVMPLLLALLVGTVEEWLQWFIPARVGELRDVLLNLFAIVCGLLFSAALDPPPRPVAAMGSSSRRAVAATLVVVLAATAAFIHVVHLGFEIQDAEAGTFRSRYSPEELAELAAQRATAWRTQPPLTWSRLSREDQYFSEGVSHVRRRNEAWAAGSVFAAAHENLILERYYAPVLDTPSYVAPQGLRWPASQRADAEARMGPGLMLYVSDGLDSPIWLWPPWTLWAVTAVVVALVLRGLR